MSSSFLSNDAGLPLVFSNGFPATLGSLSEAHLECFFNYLLDFAEVPQSARSIIPKGSPNRIHNLRSAIKNVYVRLGCKYLFHLSEALGSKLDPATILFQYGHEYSDKYVKLINKNDGQLIVTVPRSNLTYDLGLINAMKEKQKKHINEVVIFIDDSDDEVCNVSSVAEDKSQSDPPKRNSYHDVTIQRIHSRKSSKLSLLKSSPLKKSPNKSQLRDYLLYKNGRDAAYSPGMAGSQDYERSMPRICYTTSLQSWEMSSESSDSEPPPVAAILGSSSSPKKADETIVISDSSDDDIKVEMTSSGVRLPSSSPSVGVLTAKRKRKPMPASKQKSLVSKSERPTLEQKSLGSQPDPLIDHGYCHAPIDSGETSNWNKHSHEFSKVEWMSSLGLHEPSEEPNDLILLPEINQKIFNKFHRFPLSMVPLLVSMDLIRKSSLEPGLPGQDSKYTATSNISLTKRQSFRSGNHSTLGGSRYTRNSLKAGYNGRDRTEARDYRFPKRTYQTRLPAPLPRRQEKRRSLLSKNNKDSTRLSCKLPPGIKIRDCMDCYVKLTRLNLRDYQHLV